MVDDQPTIDEVLQQFHLWMKDEGMLNSRTAFVTCGDWDLGVMLPSEAKNKGFEVPPYVHFIFEPMDQCKEVLLRPHRDICKRSEGLTQCLRSTACGSPPQWN
ncbi:unnamed protein product [Cylicostephanus goldi]|uniref:Uncharacterized protein n=1 Tax=Cylicostephanus goldi TaxID=71465 RepID=A0A3P7NCW1_CYLGO|nr:unnamed protein product [Cylicostephanus goldi]